MMTREQVSRSSALIAFFAALGSAMLAVLYLVPQGTPTVRYEPLSAGQAFDLALLGSEAVISVCFALVALWLYERAKSATNLRAVAISFAVLRAVFLFWQFGTHWRPGWYYIMDPAGPIATSWTLLAGGVIQLIAFAVVGLWATGATPAVATVVPPEAPVDSA